MEENSLDSLIDFYLKSIDRTLIQENLRRTPEERLRRLQELQKFAEELRTAGEQLRRPED